MSPGRKKRIAMTLRLLAKDIALYEGTFSFSDFRKTCARLGIGIDRRTADNWAFIAITEGLIRISLNKSPHVNTYEKGVRFGEFLNGPNEEHCNLEATDD